MPSEPIDPQKIQSEFLDAVKKMMEGVRAAEPKPGSDEAGKEDEQNRQRRDRLHFSLKPKDVKRHLDRFVIKQDEAKRVLATAVCDHYHHIANCADPAACKAYSKQNILMLGPTGVGKTYLIRSLSELIGVPFAKADATKFSETGYVGGDVEDLVRELAHRAEGDIALAESGMIYLDEIDKIAASSNVQGRDVSGTGVQRGLLKIMEETDVQLRNPQDVQGQIQAMMEFQQKGKVSRPVINTRHILFIVSGAFDRLAPVVERREKKSRVGFRAGSLPQPPAEQLFRRARTEDFIEFGFEPEFIGRLPVRVVCDPLNAQDLYQILTASEGSVLRQYESAFRAYGIELHFQDDALWEIAKRAGEEGTGARGLVTVCERIFRDVKYELPSTGLRAFTLTREFVLSPCNGLEALLKEERADRTRHIRQDVRAYEERFRAKSSIDISFDDSAVRAVERVIFDTDATVEAFLDRLLANYPYGLGLVQKQKPREIFVLGEAVITDPNAALEKWIKESYE